jgi:hypothetical protein
VSCAQCAILQRFSSPSHSTEPAELLVDELREGGAACGHVSCLGSVHRDDVVFGWLAFRIAQAVSTMALATRCGNEMVIAHGKGWVADVERSSSRHFAILHDEGRKCQADLTCFVKIPRVLSLIRALTAVNIAECELVVS